MNFIYHKFLFLPQSFLAQEYDGRFENETHCVQFQTFLDFTKKVGNIEPLDTSIIQKISRA